MWHWRKLARKNSHNVAVSLMFRLFIANAKGTFFGMSETFHVSLKFAIRVF